METLLPYALLCLTSIFTLANPLGTMPVFLTMTQGMSEEQRQSIVKRATITALIILYNFAGVWAMARVLLPKLLGRRGKALVNVIDGWIAPKKA